MYTYRIVLDAYSSRTQVPGARVITYSRGYSRTDALRKIGLVHIAPDGTVSDGINPWPGTNNLPPGPHTARSLPEWEVIAMRAVKHPGTARLVWTTR